MPSINIQEVDLTLPGNPDSYANYGVLIPGFAKPGFDESKCDNNGAIEFTSQEDFKKVIGLVAPHVSAGDPVANAKARGVEASGGYYHYGNQMAYELLGMGYPITYIPLLQADAEKTKTDKLKTIITQLGRLQDGDFWAPFEDKISYDFRFITHGLLTSDADANGIPGSPESATWNGTMDTAFINKANSLISQLAGKRMDCVALAEIDELTYITKEFKMELEATGDSKGSGATNNSEETEVSTLAAGATENVGPGATSTYTVKLQSAEDAIRLAVAGLNLNEKDAIYSTITVPSVTYYMAPETDYSENKKFPGGFHYLACFSNAIQKGYAEWYAAAGYTRGISKYTVDHATVKLGEIAINTLEPRQATTTEVQGTIIGEKDREGAPVTKDIDLTTACNVIANFRGAYYLWGNRTAAKLDNTDLNAKHFLNIRQLCTTIKKQLFVACRRFTFDPNSDTLWVNFVNAIRPTLELMKADQGIRDYKILKEPTDKKATLKARIRIIPIEAVEDFDITVSLEDAFGDTVANIEG